MQKNEKPWHKLTMMCPKCGCGFQPQVIDLYTRLCPTCEHRGTDQEKKQKLPYCAAIRETLSKSKAVLATKSALPVMAGTREEARLT